MMNFSIIIPLYNKQNFISRAVQSVLSQSHKNFELIIVNDGSTDNSLMVVSKFKDYRIKLVNKENGGVSSARNTGIDASSNEWICFLDADDYWLTNHLEEISYLLRNYPEGKIYSTLKLEKTNNGLRTITNQFPDNFEGYVENYFSFAKKDTVFNSSSVCINKKALIEIDKFDTNLTHGEDLDVWFKLLINYKGVIKSKATVIYDLFSENRAMKSICSIDKHLLSKINSFRSDEIYGLNEFIDYFILRNSITYYFSNDKQNVVPIILTVKNRKKISVIWVYIYMDIMYSINLFVFKLYKAIKTIVS